MGTSNGVSGYLTSNKNLLGMMFAAVGPVLALSGVVAGPIGLAIGVPLYAVGALIAPHRAAAHDIVVGTVDGADVRKELAEVERSIRGRVHPSVEERVHRIADTIRETLPRADALGPGSAQAHSLVQTATDYLPEALAAYLKLPRTYAERQPVSNGRTSLQLLCDQLDLLGARMHDVFTAVCQSDADALVAHGRFLNEKFAPGSLDLGRTVTDPSQGRPPAPPSP
ncbi:MAG: hypothetical protein ACOYMR_04820 [Ilumatobacteraceae bacterium]